MEANGLAIDRGAQHELQFWPYSSLRSITPPTGRTETIIEQDGAPGAQLLINDADAIKQLARVAPGLKSSVARRRWLVSLGAVLAVAATAIALVWYLEPQPSRAIAEMIPERTRQSIGRTVIEQFKAQGRECASPAGRRALDKLMARLLAGEPDTASYKITVVDLPYRNAFATMGGQMVITAKMIEAARTPDEVAGVLAHEIGHGIERHPDAGLVRRLGLSLIFEMVVGGSGVLTGLTLQALDAGYTRQDERAADQQALRLLRHAKISQRGIEDLFARGAKTEGGGLSAIDFLRTHPYSSERLAAVRRAPTYRATAALTTDEWRALRAICAKP